MNSNNLRNEIEKLLYEFSYEVDSDHGQTDLKTALPKATQEKSRTTPEKGKSNE